MVNVPSFAATLSVLLLLAGPASAQQDPAPAETNPQSSATTTVKAPAGVTTPAATENQTQGMGGAQTGCKSASAEMTNGAVVTCQK